MYVRQRLNEAYENVQFTADRTWTNIQNDYQQTNMELYLTERYVEEERLPTYRPRNVRECIPSSRLARYSNYVYNESREMSYASSVSNLDTKLSIEFPTEPWQMPEVGDLYKWFLKNQPEDYCSRLKGHYESPLLKVTGFEDKILKIQITEGRVKNIWNKDYHQCGGTQNRTHQFLVNFFTSPMKSVYLFNNEHYNYEWFRNISLSRDFDQLEQLSKSFKEQTTSTIKILTGVNEPQPSTSEAMPTEILYSEVLQGLTPSRKLISSIKNDHGKSDDQQPSTSQENFTNYTVLNSQRSGQIEPSKSDSFNPVPQISNKFLPQKNTTPSVSFHTDTQTYPRYKYHTHFPRTTMFQTFSSSYVQQTYFYTPVQATQRWMPPNITSYYPTQIFTQTWYTHKPVVPTVNRIFGPSHLTIPSDNISGQFFDCVRVEDSQFKEEAVEFEPFEEPQVSRSVSDDLAIQALEQYSDSNENFMQELERQAVEQFTNSPD